jgi:hypothetical protein
VRTADLTDLHMLALGVDSLPPVDVPCRRDCGTSDRGEQAEQLLANLEAAGLIHAMTEQ